MRLRRQHVDDTKDAAVNFRQGAAYKLGDCIAVAAVMKLTSVFDWRRTSHVAYDQLAVNIVCRCKSNQPSERTSARLAAAADISFA